MVLGAGLADLLLVTTGADVLLLIDRAAGRGRRRRPRPAWTWPDSSGRIRLDSVTSSMRCPARLPTHWPVPTRCCSPRRAVGGAADCVDTAVGYAKVQEWPPIATFPGDQAPLRQHGGGRRETATALVWDAARTADDDDPAAVPVDGRGVPPQRSPAYLRNAELNIQVHGGIRFTWDTMRICLRRP